MTTLPRIVPPELADLRRRVRELEAQVQALAALLQPVKKARAEAPQKQAIRDIVADVAARHAVPVEDIVGCNRTRPAARARAEAMAIARQNGRTLGQIARAFNRHHTTVLLAVRKHEAGCAE